MKQLKFMFAIGMLGLIDATPLCELHGAEQKQLKCYSHDTDYELKRGLVSDYRDVKTISLKTCKITKVHCDAFKGLPSLETLDMAENKIQDLMPCILDELPQLRSLNLTNNRIAQLHLEVFGKMQNLEALYLKGNKLKQIQYGLLQKMTKLKTLDLSNNAFDGKPMSGHIFENNKQVEYLDLSRNYLIGATEDLLEAFETLKTLYLDRCFLSQVPSFTTTVNLKSLKHLVLSNNQISSLNNPTIFINLDNLEFLNFDGNAIDSISENVFRPLKKLKTIVLRHNKLKQIPDKLFQNMPKLISIDLSYNLIEKIEVSSFQHTPLKNLNLSGNKLAYLPDNFYEKLVSSGGLLKKFLFGGNPWKCSCLRDLLAEMKNNDVEYNSAKYNGNESICIADDNFNCLRE